MWYFFEYVGFYFFFYFYPIFSFSIDDFSKQRWTPANFFRAFSCCLGVFPPFVNVVERVVENIVFHGGILGATTGVFFFSFPFFCFSLGKGSASFVFHFPQHAIVVEILEVLFFPQLWGVAGSSFTHNRYMRNNAIPPWYCTPILMRYQFARCVHSQRASSLHSQKNSQISINDNIFEKDFADSITSTHHICTWIQFCSIFHNYCLAQLNNNKKWTESIH